MTKIKEVKKEISQRQIINELNCLGISTHSVANHYLRTAISLCLQNNKYLETITKDLYFVVGLKHDMAPQKVERTIKCAITSATATKVDNEVWKELFSNRKPTDVEFITQVVRKLQEEIF